MPARALRTYLILANAPDEGLAFPYPPWWDIERLITQYPGHRIPLSRHEEALLLSWASLLSWQKETGQWIEAVPRKASPPPEANPDPETVSRVLSRAEWIILHNGWVWIATRENGPATHLIDGPYWWMGRAAPFDRFIEDDSNLIDLNYVGLITGSEALDLDTRQQQAFKEWKGHLSRYDRQQMARFHRLLRQTIWAVLYWYEWESGFE